MSVQIVNIELLGVSFSVQTDESAEYIEGLVARLRERIDGLRASTRVQDPLKLSILAGVTILDELSRAKEGFGPMGAGNGPMRAGPPAGGPQAGGPLPGEDEFSRVAARLIADLDRSLEAPGR
jgi:cell division protein ZapA (FtsZ GTPase activity inhibitor)